VNQQIRAGDDGDDDPRIREMIGAWGVKSRSTIRVIT
jgi:hypothetical protein